ncbi:acyl carrier protein [Aureivirga marina]|uniref:acyl carrier protein n=1 Tax=Aureivirga marina TaxID=1182451 RepID=UPI0018CB116C|nr:acyl carrier protein [Aureivirga marina]
MKDKIIKILIEARPEFDFNEIQEDFISGGMLDSFDIISIVSDIETELGVSIQGDKILPENFDSLQAIEDLIKESSC